ncbi:hypothetical protein MCNS_53700 [Mycobacterium conspicuum]|uniref:Uncharacterized protein n=1 Tax=Mycobacterium conspicuum TaxID=44010 RepID=A0A7I7YLT3_9MYCO|nr:hypothetical protein MCNS_53700 [Mycobacterium conspicuum]
MAGREKHGNPTQIHCASSHFDAELGSAGCAGGNRGQEWPEDDKLSYSGVAAVPHEGQEASVRSNHAAAARSL